MSASKKESISLIINGFVPSCSVRAELGPPRTECGVGALMQWLDKLYVVPYVSSGIKSGKGVGLYIIEKISNVFLAAKVYLEPLQIGWFTFRVISLLLDHILLTKLTELGI